jgi:hypothetical protein
MLRKLKILIAMSLIPVAQLFSADIARMGTAAGVQVLQPVGARSIALGGSNLATTNSVDAIYWNPAGLSKMTGAAEGHFSTMNIFNDIQINYFALGVSMGDYGVAGVSIKSFDFGDIPLTTNEDHDGSTGQTYSPTFATLTATYSIGLTDKISVGVNSKLIIEEVPRASAQTVAFDIGLQYAGFAGMENISFGLAIKNIGGNIQYSGSGLSGLTSGGEYLSRNAASHDLPSTFELGVAYRYNLDETNSINASSMFQNNNYSNDNIKFGVEYIFQDLVMVRGGYNYANEIDAEDNLYDFSLGAGLKYELGETMLQLDYAFRNDQYFDANNMFSFTVGF